MSKTKNVFIVILFLSFAIGFGQNNAALKEDAKLIDENAKDSIEVKPEPYEGLEKFYANVQKSVRIPENEPSGTYKVKVSFVVDKEGVLSDYKIIEQTPMPIGLGGEVIRVLKTYPKWKPGSKKTFFMLPVTIVIVADEIETTPKKD